MNRRQNESNPRVQSDADQPHADPPVPEHKKPSKSGYGHAPSDTGSTKPQGGGNPIGPEEGAGEKRRNKPPA